MKPNVLAIRDRADLLRDLRSFFDSRSFLEVQPPCLSRDCVVDPFIDPLSLQSAQLSISQPGLPPQFFLQTSPESAMKRMLAAGAPSIYSIGPVFRSGEAGTMHNIEFTMLEWYEVGGNMKSAVQLLGTLAARMLNCDGYQTITYRTAFQTYLGFDPIKIDLPDLQQRVAAHDDQLGASIHDHDDCLDVLMSELIQPQLGHTQPVIVTDYPLSQAALAKPSEQDPQCAARFELFARGVELANGYDELLDADILVQRATASNAKRRRAGRTLLPVETCLVDAMRSGLPQSAGVALGVDRLLMLRAGATSIQQVMPFTISIA